MSSFPSLEGFSIKKRDYFQPDVYPQKVQQREDEMSDSHVKEGYKYCKPVIDEYESCYSDHEYVDEMALWNLYYNILSRKYAFGKVPDTKTNQINNIRLATSSKSKNSHIIFYEELAGNCSLTSLIKRFPEFNTKKDEVISELVKHRVPLNRAIWHINRCLLYTPTAVEPVRKKAKTSNENHADWGYHIFEYLNKLIEIDLHKVSNSNLDSIIHDWEYLFNILVVMYDLNIIEHSKVIMWLVETAELIYPLAVSESDPIPKYEVRSISENSPLLKFYLPYILKFGRRFTESEVCTRRLLYWSCAIFSNLVNQEISYENFSTVSFQKLLQEYMHACRCDTHRVILFSLSYLITSLTISSPASCVWNNVPYERSAPYYSGSPLDLLPCPLICLPLAPSHRNVYLRYCLLQTEEDIIRRSHLAEAGWNLPVKSNISDNVELLVKILQLLDTFDYSCESENGTLENLASNLIGLLRDPIDQASSLIRFICEWAVTPYRSGLHRPIIAACLLEHIRGNPLLSALSQTCFQQSFVIFLDKQAPRMRGVLSHFNQSVDVDFPFKCLVCLFGELIDRQLFNHDAYVTYCISHGYLEVNNNELNLPWGSTHQEKGHPPSVGPRHTFSIQSEVSEENYGSVENPDSVRSDVGKMHLKTAYQLPNQTMSRHLEYVIHFPLPQDDSYLHEINQRGQVLYGSSRMRDRAKSRLKKFVRDICKLFTKKTYLIDIVNGELGKKKKSRLSSNIMDPSGSVQSGGSGVVGSGNEDSRSIDDVHDEILIKFRALSYHDMEYVISQCMSSFYKMLSGTYACPGASGSDANTSSGSMSNFGSPSTKLAQMVNVPGVMSTSAIQQSRYLSLPNIVCLFFDLIEISLNIVCLLNTVSDTLNYLQPLFEMKTHCITMYKSCLCFRILGILRKYNEVLMTLPDIQKRVLKDLCMQMKSIKEVTQCIPSERCILLYIKDLYHCSHTIRKEHVQLSNAVELLANLVSRRKPSEEQCAYSLELCEDFWRSFNENSPKVCNLAAELRKCSSKRLTFVTQAINMICSIKSTENLQRACNIFNELTSQCVELASEWLTIFHALLYGLQPKFPIVFDQINQEDLTIYDNLSTLIGTLLSCEFILASDLFFYVINPAMANVLLNTTSQAQYKCTRLTLHIIHRLFTADVNTVTCVNSQQSNSSAPNNSMTGHQLSQPSPQNASTQSPAGGVHLSGVGNTAGVSQIRVNEPCLLSAALQRINVRYLIDTMKFLILYSVKESNGGTGCDDQEATMSSQYLIDLEECFDENSREHNSMLQDDEANAWSNDNDSDFEEISGQAAVYESDEEVSSSGRKRRKCAAQTAAGSAKKRRRKGAGSMGGKRKRHLGYRYIHVSVKRFLDSGQLPTDGELSTMRICDLAHLILREICTTDWIRLYLTKMTPDQLLHKHVLLDRNFPEADSRRLLHMLYWPRDLAWADAEDIPLAMHQLLGKLNLWTLHYAHLEFELLRKQIPNLNNDRIMEAVASTLVRRFQGQACAWLKSDPEHSQPPDGVPEVSVSPSDSTWLLPYMEKVPKLLREPIVRVACDTLKGIKNVWKNKNDEEKERILLKSSVLLAHPAFFALLKRFLVDCRDLCDSLAEQVEYFIQNAKEIEDRVPDNLRTRQVIQECLGLRLALVGHRMRSQTDPDFQSKWMVLLAQLIIHGVCEPESNDHLFYMILDMLHSLYYSLLSRLGPNNKPLMSVIKKVRKELADKPPNAGLEHIRPLLLDSKNPTYMNVYTVSSVAPTDHVKGGSKSGSDSGKPNSKGGNFNSGSSGSNALQISQDNTVGGGLKAFSRKRGYVVSKRDACNPHVFLDPSHLNLLYTTYGAVFCDANLESFELSQMQRLISHEHYVKMRSSVSHYIESPVDPVIEIVLGKLMEVQKKNSVQRCLTYDDSASSHNASVKSVEEQKVSTPNKIPNQHVAPSENIPIPGQGPAPINDNHGGMLHHYPATSGSRGNANVPQTTMKGPPNRTVSSSIPNSIPGQMGPDQRAKMPTNQHGQMMPQSGAPGYQNVMAPQGYIRAQHRPSNTASMNMMNPAPSAMSMSGGRAPYSTASNTSTPSNPTTTTTTTTKRKRNPRTKNSASAKASAAASSGAANNQQLPPCSAAMIPGGAGPGGDMYTFTSGNSNSGGSMPGWNASGQGSVQHHSLQKFILQRQSNKASGAAGAPGNVVPGAPPGMVGEAPHAAMSQSAGTGGAGVIPNYAQVSGGGASGMPPQHRMTVGGMGRGMGGGGPRSRQMPNQHPQQQPPQHPQQQQFLQQQSNAPPPQPHLYANHPTSHHPGHGHHPQSQAQQQNSVRNPNVSAGVMPDPPPYPGAQVATGGYGRPMVPQRGSNLISQSSQPPQQMIPHGSMQQDDQYSTNAAFIQRGGYKQQPPQHPNTYGQ